MPIKSLDEVLEDYQYVCKTHLKKMYWDWNTDRFLCAYCVRESMWKAQGIPYHVCPKHKLPYKNGCSGCGCERRRYETRLFNSRFIEEDKRKQLWRQAFEERRKHLNESCSNCNKSIVFDEWFCYCSLCPECYLQTPEEELERIDDNLDELMKNDVNMMSDGDEGE